MMSGVPLPAVVAFMAPRFERDTGDSATETRRSPVG
jgi:hypothetical protein